MSLAISVVFPVAVAVLCGFALGRWGQVPAAPLAKAGVYVFGPALLLANVPATLANDLPLLALTVGAALLMLVVGRVLAAALGETDPDRRDAIVFATGFSNFGFVGLPLVELAFGPEAFAMGIAVLTFLNIPTGILAVFLASPQPSVVGALRHTMREPFSIAVVASLILGLGGLSLPNVVQRPLDLLADGAIPCMLVVLGIQLASLDRQDFSLASAVAVLVARLLISPAVVFGIAVIAGMDIDGLAVKCATLQLATPPGITPLIFMITFGRNPGPLAGLIFWGTIGSVFTVPLVAGLLR